MTTELRLIAGGDIMLGEHPAMVGRGVATQILRNPSFDPFAKIAKIIREAEISVANLECALSDWPPACLPSRRECRGPAAAIPLLSRAGFTALSLANNHIQQHGSSAVQETVSALEKSNIAVVGRAGVEPGTCIPVDIEVRGLTVRLLGYSLRPRQHFLDTPFYAEGTREGMLADIAAGQQAGAVVVVSVHWGDEFISTPSQEQVALGRAMVDQGASLVIGHHPHVLQGWERYRQGAILYSLGNLVFDMPWSANLRQTALCECLLSSAGCVHVEWHPLLLNKNHCPEPAPPGDSEEIISFLDAACRDLTAGTGSLAAPGAEDYLRQLAAASAAERWRRNRYFLRNIFRYRVDVSCRLISQFILRRIGLLHD